MWLALFFTAMVGGSSAPTVTGRPSNGKELSAACRLADVNERFGRCDQTALVVLSEFAHYGKGSGETGGDLKFCLPVASRVTVENVQPLIDVYRAQYQREPNAFAAVSPIAAFLRAMRRQWPCRGGR
jgi:hypothetical protein